MDKIFLRNFLLFVVLLMTCVSVLIANLVSSDRELGKIDERVIHTHKVITEAEQLTARIKGMLAAQRGYLLTGDDIFLEEYSDKKSEVSEHITQLTELTTDNASQQDRLGELRNYYRDFYEKLEAPLDNVDPLAANSADKEILNDVSIVNTLKNSIIDINSAVLNEEYDMLNNSIVALEAQKTKYYTTLIVGICIGSVLLLIFNGFLLRAQRKRSTIEASLKSSEDRFALAVEGTQDGIFDWDITNDRVYYSRRFFEMLGYDDKPRIGHKDDFGNLLHPEDAPKVWQRVEQYLNGELSEYSQEFRMKHKSGRWVWVESRGRALFDKKGVPYRMVGAHTDISHRVAAKAKLEAEKNMAEQSNQAKRDFLAHMSHEIRTPLTAISGIAEILEKNQEDLSDKQKKLIGTLSSSTTSLKDLISDILDFSKIESGELELEESNFQIDEVVEQVVSMMAMKANEKGVSFVLDYDVLKDKIFYGDPVRFRQIVINLISNAIKFTESGGSVTVHTDFEDREGIEFLRLDVTDTGIGIAPENFDLIFERFKQGDSSVSRKYGGTGLGLPISRNLACLMGGDIFISSEVGKGSTFTLLLPAKISSSGQDDIVSKRENKKLSDRIQAAINEETKVLIVEDYEGNVVVIGYILDELGISYDVAETGLQALNKWQENHYDVILMDVQMPEMDGFTATKKIRAIEEEKKFNRTPIIGMTAHALVGDKDKCVAVGMDSYLPKPIIEADFKKEILKYLKNSKKKAA
jgi:PAS domain S-box-containing protein